MMIQKTNKNYYDILYKIHNIKKYLSQTYNFYDTNLKIFYINLLSE